VAEIYETNRPGYPAETVSWLLDDQPARVIDVGAGTGKLTRLLTESGRTVTAVDPSELMLDRLRGALPDVDRLVGTAERLPLPDRSAELITVAQAWHWVDPPLASAEIGRVLRPGGRLGLVWNLRDERVGWVRDLGVAMHADGDQYAVGLEDPVVAEPFGEPERFEVGWTHELSRAGLLDLIRSRSYVAVMAEPDRAATLGAVRNLLDTHPDLAGTDPIRLPYVAVAYRYRRP
jgi:SAM-dependent methyltransferase